MVFTIRMYGYTTFLPGWCYTDTFFSYYTMCFVSLILYAGWKIIKKTKVVKPHEADLVWERPLIDAYEETLVDNGSKGFWDDCAKAIGIRKRHSSEDTIELS
jgi:amino acid transporter